MKPSETTAIRGHRNGELETVKFDKRKPAYYNALNGILELGYTPEDYLHYFPAFVGHVTLWRNFTLYEMYKKTLGLAGHIAEIGVYKGSSAILFAKLLQLFEPEALTMVHGFDWFKGTHAQTEEDKLQVDGSHVESEERLRKLVSLQDLDPILKIHNLDVTVGLDDFFKHNSHLRFKLVFLDSGNYDVVANSIQHFWPRIVPGGFLVLDQYNHEVAPGETRAISDLLPDLKVETLPNSWMPNAFIQKPFAK